MKKKLIVSLLAVLLLVGLAWAASIGYYMSHTEQDVTIYPKYDEYHNTEITMIAPSSVIAGEEFKVSGYLKDADTGEPLADKTVSVTWFGSFDINQVHLKTDENGYYEGMKKALDYNYDKPTAENLRVTFLGY
ncbi:MAG: carboxypeptidase-like regulatory domain-containing protein [Proteobacteria bacterium]|nr:carboxypeptidase-like regulatory domain-containing protein [Pseudomonadota bacterium]